MCNSLLLKISLYIGNVLKLASKNNCSIYGNTTQSQIGMDYDNWTILAASTKWLSPGCHGF